MSVAEWRWCYSENLTSWIELNTYKYKICE